MYLGNLGETSLGESTHPDSLLDLAVVAAHLVGSNSVSCFGPYFASALGELGTRENI